MKRYIVINRHIFEAIGLETTKHWPSVKVRIALQNDHDRQALEKWFQQTMDFLTSPMKYKREGYTDTQTFWGLWPEHIEQTEAVLSCDKVENRIIVDINEILKEYSF